MNKDFASCRDSDPVMGCPCQRGSRREDALPDSLPLAMAYVRMQSLGQMYPPETALKKGTLFPELELPFCGRTIGGKNA